MSRTFEVEPILAAIIEVYHEEGHFIFNKEGKIYARFVAAEDDHGAISPPVKVDVCLTNFATNLTERLNR